MNDVTVSHQYCDLFSSIKTRMNTVLIWELTQVTFMLTLWIDSKFTKYQINMKKILGKRERVREGELQGVREKEERISTSFICYSCRENLSSCVLTE